MGKRCARRFWPALALLLALAGAAAAGGAAPARTSAAHGNADAITAEELHDFLGFIASDEMEGRDTPSRGLNTTARFIAMNLARWGIHPAGDDGTYFQKIELRRSQIDPEGTHAEIDGQPFRYSTDFRVESGGFRPVPGGTASGKLVYAGHGFVVPEKQIDPYRGIDVQGRIVVVTGGTPEGIDPRALLRGRRGRAGAGAAADIRTPEQYAREHGAVGVIALPSFPALAAWGQERAPGQAGGRYQVAAFQAADSAPLPSITISPAMVARLFSGEKRSGAEIFREAISGQPGDSFALSDGKRASFTVAVKTDEATTQNVVGVLEGGDPSLRSEYVALGAHYDHLGVGRPVNGDGIYNGADDDGSGTTALLGIADALAHSSVRPKRSVLFVWHCGEEKGLWGSRYFTAHPTVPIDHIAAQLNIDMIGRSKPANDTNVADKELSGPDEIYVIGSRMMSSELGDLSERVNNGYLHLRFNYRYDDPNDPNGFFFRSDHFNYAQKGIPIIFYFDGVHVDYHQPSDQVEKIDFHKMEEVTRTICATLWEIANAPHRPVVDRKLPTELRG